MVRSVVFLFTFIFDKKALPAILLSYAAIFLAGFIAAAAASAAGAGTLTGCCFISFVLSGGLIAIATLSSVMISLFWVSFIEALKTVD